MAVEENPKLAPPDNEEDELAGSEAPLLDHLIELRKRLIYSILAVAAAMIVCFVLAGPIFEILLWPYRWVAGPTKPIELIYTAPQEYFFTQLNIAMFGGLFLGFPMIAVQVYMFVAPGLYRRERKAFVPYLIATPVFFVLGGLVVYFGVLPMALRFFSGMQTSEIRMLVSVKEYLGLATTLIIAFGVCFQLPVILTLLARIDLIGVDFLKKGRKYAIVAILCIAAILTPPDPVSQISLTVPMYALYELSILSVRYVERQRAARRAAEDAAQS
jgi:sec-independent protein translocase protein TatC